MILDTDGTMCVKAMFTFSTSGNVQRSYRIHNVQFGGNNDMGGPAGCLQYYTGEMGTVNSFNWNGIAAGMHLQWWQKISILSSREERRFLYFNHLSKDFLEQMIPHLKALI